jgi:glycosyltransferase involved in cell wall biosynthesis
VEGDLLFAAPEPGSSLDRRRLPPYLSEAVNLARRHPQWADYDVVFTWELRSALAAALLMKPLGKRRPRFVAVGPIIKGGMRGPRALSVVRWLLRDADRIVCFARSECDEYAQLLRLPRERFVFLPTPWLADEEETDRDDGYILALGQSNRDYPTLLEAVRGTDLPVTLVAANSSALGGVEPPPNVCVRYNTGHDETNDLIAGATLHCIPLHEAGYSAGQTVLLRAMARGKAVVVSDTLGVRDYARDGETAVLVPPGEAAALRAALSRLWSDDEERRRIGRQAARSVREEFGFERFAREMVRIAEEVSEKRYVSR